MRSASTVAPRPEGAIEMSRTEVDEGRSQDATALAEEIMERRPPRST